MVTTVQNQPNEPKDDNISPEDVNNQPADNGADDDYRPSDDPLMREFEAAMAEEKGQEAAGGKDADNNQKAETDGTQGTTEQAKPAENASHEANQEGKQAGDAIMIPKPRLDEVLAKNSELQAKLDYMSGVTTTQQQMMEMLRNSASQTTQQNQQAAPEPQKDFETLVGELENKKLELAEKYDEGELSTKDYEAQKVEIDRSIRKMLIDQNAQQADLIKQQTQAAAQQQLTQQQIASAAEQLMVKHPYVKEIDALPNADGAWQFINSIAQNNLIQRGINPNDGSVQSQLAMMQEKAALTDQHGAYLTGKQLSMPQGSNTPTIAGGLTQQQKERLDKINLAQQQPPSASGVAGTGQEQQFDDTRIEEMSMDELANLPDHIARKYMDM